MKREWSVGEKWCCCNEKGALEGRLLVKICVRCHNRRVVNEHKLVNMNGGLVENKGHFRHIVRHRRSRLSNVRRKEYGKLRQMLPSLQQKHRVSKVEVIEGAIQYIDDLHAALIQRFKSRGLPFVLNGVNVSKEDMENGKIKEVVCRMLANTNPTSLPPSRIENARTTPSFLHKLTKSRKL